MRVSTLNDNQKEQMGNMLIAMLFFVAVAISAVIFYQGRLFLRNAKKIYHSFKIKFEGSVIDKRGCNCVVSFPGKFETGWNAVVRAGKFKSMSVSCIFLPDGTPKYGEHSLNPETGKCWCYNLYGKPADWGCLWFKLWKDLVEKAVKLKQRLKVYYFPGEVGEGEVLWEDMADHSALRDEVMAGVPKKENGWPKKLTEKEHAEYLAKLSPEHRRCMVGLGGSQKGEVAWLLKRLHETGYAGYKFDRIDVRELVVSEGLPHLPVMSSVLAELELQWDDIKQKLMLMDLGDLESAIVAASEKKDYSKLQEIVRKANGDFSQLSQPGQLALCDDGPVYFNDVAKAIEVT